jgi:hypothetical protein
VLTIGGAVLPPVALLTKKPADPPARVAKKPRPTSTSTPQIAAPAALELHPA